MTPGMTLTFLRQGQLKFAHTFEWGKLLQCHLKGKTCSNWQIDCIFMI